MENKPYFVKYFAKFLPIDGEIKEGDLFTCPHRGHSIDVGKGLSHTPKTVILKKDGGIGASRTCPDCKKVKLFLCSRDIQVGDEMIYEGTGKKVIATAERLEFKPRGFKIIGEISPEATFVKEGDTFEQDEIQILVTDPNDSNWFADFYCKEDWSEEIDMGFTLICKLKGPCGHFH